MNGIRNYAVSLPTMIMLVSLLKIAELFVGALIQQPTTLPSRPTPAIQYQQPPPLVGWYDEEVVEIVIETEQVEVVSVEPEQQPRLFALSAAMQRTMQHENNKRLPQHLSGYNSDRGLWFPHKSIEGGNKTIGYGHKLTDSEVYSGLIEIQGQGYWIDDGLTDEQTIALFKQDWNKAEQLSLDWFGDNHPREVQGVLTEMYYQMGNNVKSFRKFKRYLDAGNYEQAANEMLDSKWARVDSPERAHYLSETIRKYW